jgi:hypothetical protein
VLACAVCASPERLVDIQSGWLNCYNKPLSEPACPDSLVQVFPVHKIALEWFNDRIRIPFGPVLVLEEVLYAGPAKLTVKLATIALIKKFTMLKANVLLVLFAVLDFHFDNPPVSAPPSSPLHRRSIQSTRHNSITSNLCADKERCSRKNE